MSLQLDPLLILYFAFGLVLLYIAGWLLLAPFKMLLKLALNSALGAAALVLFNLLGGIFYLNIPLTPLNAVVVGALGVPGFVLLLVLQLIL